MADRLTSAELEQMQESVKETTDLSKKLRDVFKDINRQTDLTSNGFKNIIAAAQTNQNLAERYLIAQKASETITAKINELKGKTGYLDKLSLDFKEQELLLQRDIMAAQLQAVQTSNNISAQAKQQAIDKLRTEEALRDAEFQVLKAKNSSASSNNAIILQLQQQLGIIEGFTPSLQRSTGYLSGFSKYIGNSNTSKMASDFGKMGEYLKDGLPTGKQFFQHLIEKGYENFKLFDKAAVSVRSHLGVLPGQAKQLEVLIKQVGIDSMHLGATFEDVAKSINAITDEFTSLVAQDKSLLTTTTALAKQFGVAESTSVKFLKTLGGISDNSASSQKSMIGFAQKMASASGVPLGKIMEDVANASDDARMFIGASATAMVKAATAARMMGIDLNKAASTAEKLLQFESSISSELKASALLGQNVNFNYARQLSFSKDIIGANKEILNIAKQVNFNQLNPIQQKAFAEAAGKSVSELQDMLIQEKNIQLVRNGTNQAAKKALTDYENMMKMKDEEARKVGEVAEQEIIRKANQEKLAQLQNQFNKMMSELAVPVMEIVNGFLTVANIALPIIVKGIAPLYGSVFAISNVIRLSTILFKNLKAAASAGYSFGNAIKASFKTFSKIPSFFTKFSGIFKIFGTVGKFLGPIGLVINAFMFINNLVKRFQEFVGKDGLIVGGLKAVGYAIYDTLLQPFIDVYDWIMSKLGANSPSEIGLSIVKGLVSVSGMILDALVRPFIMGYNLISKYIPGMSEVKMPSEVLSDLSGDAKNTKAGIATSSGESVLVSAIQTSNQQLVAKMDQLIAMMANGGIAVNLDGQRVNAALSKTTYRSGGFGQATSLA
jgi:hypothetical protein